MQPLSPHWADTTAIQIVKERERSGASATTEPFVVASGITPSGMVHFGNFREVITVDFVARALQSLGKKVRFIYSWDSFDTFRKVPRNLPDPQSFERYLRMPIARIPDPWQKEESYAMGRIKDFESELEKVAIQPEFIYQHQEYSTSRYASGIRKALESRIKIKEILDRFRTAPLPDTWLPTSIYCESCDRDEMIYQRYDGEWNYSYKCASCGHEATADIRTTRNLKLSWRVDWPMRWDFEKVEFEPGGKDHSSQGGSYDTAKQIVAEVWNRKAPIYLQYDFVMIKGGSGKMSSSSGELYNLSQVLEVYDPQIVRWIFASQRPNTDFSVAFDEDVIKTHDEFDRAEEMAFQPRPEKPGKWPVIRRAYELSLLKPGMPARKPYRPPFRSLCDRLQICDMDIGAALDRFYRDDISSEEDRAAFLARARCALNWVQKHAPAGFRYQIHSSRVDIELSEQEKSALQLMRGLLEGLDLDAVGPKDLNELIYAKVIHASQVDPKRFFVIVYQKLIGRDQGPRLPSFLKEIGRERIIKLL